MQVLGTQCTFRPCQSQKTVLLISNLWSMNLVDRTTTLLSLFTILHRRIAQKDFCKLEQGLPFRVILYTHSIGGSIGNYHFIWKIPKHENADGVLTQNHKVVKYHNRAMWQDLINKCGRLIPGANSYALREMYRTLTGVVCKDCVC